MDVAGPTPRVPKHEVRRRLMDAAAEVFAEHGYDGTRLEDVAHRAGFTKGAVYSNFGGKDELFSALLDDHTRQVTDVVVASLPIGGDPVALAEAAAAAIADLLVEQRRFTQLSLEFTARAARDDAARATFAPYLREQRRSLGALADQYLQQAGYGTVVDTDRVALILTSLCKGLGLENAADPESFTADVVRDAITAVLVGLLTRASVEATAPRSP